METFKSIMVSLDFTAMDHTLIKYAAFLSEKVKPTSIYFIHVSRHLAVEEELREKFPELQVPRDEKLKHEMQETVEQHFKGLENYKVNYKVEEGSPLKEILHWSEIKNVDLLLLGRKRELKGSGVLPQRISRKINCSLLFVPENTPLQLDKILLPSDFSENAELALNSASQLAKASSAILNFHHIFYLPDGYYTTGKSEEEFIEIMRENAEKRYEKKVKPKLDSALKVEATFSYDKQQSHSDLIMQQADNVNADLIVIGAKGRTFATAILLGSVTEKLLQKNDHIPTLVIKEKDKDFNILEWLKVV